MPATRIAALLLAVAGPATAQGTPQAFSANYACDGGAVLQVAYVNPDNGPAVAALAWAGHVVPLIAGPTASGARYVSEAAGLIWHTKGDGGTLLGLAADEALLTGCRRIPGP